MASPIFNNSDEVIRFTKLSLSEKEYIISCAILNESNNNSIDSTSNAIVTSSDDYDDYDEEEILKFNEYYADLYKDYDDEPDYDDMTPEQQAEINRMEIEYIQRCNEIQLASPIQLQSVDNFKTNICAYDSDDEGYDD